MSRQSHTSTRTSAAPQQAAAGHTGKTLPAVPVLAQNEASPISEPTGSEYEPITQRKAVAPFQLKKNDTGIPDDLKTGIEQLSGMDISDVRVYYNSARPAQLQAHAYAQGNNIHIGPGQEKHLPHEAWHVVQQRQGRVKATRQMKRGVMVNDDPLLEQEADVMGAKALSTGKSGQEEALQLVSAKSHGDQVIQRVWDNYESDDSDHTEGSAPELLIDWSELRSQAFSRVPQAVLFNIFYNLAEHLYHKAGYGSPDRELMVGSFIKWFTGGVHTRSMFKRLIGLEHVINDKDETGNIIQLARTGNTYSVNGGYQGTSNGTGYENVIYYRDGDGNIDFGENPANIVAAYNSSEDPEIDAKDIVWSDPIDYSSKVQMNNDLTDNEKGIMPSGKSVTLKSASRSQHFAIADMLYSNSRGGTWTWHHLSPRYNMILVDMKVHAKHGHNGGVHLWT